MRRILVSMFVVALALGLALEMALAQAPRTPEALSAWLYFKEIPVRAGASGWADLVLDRDVLDAARTDHADVRLYDAGGKEIPYVLRVRRGVDTTDAFTAREFNRGDAGGGTQISYDLGEEEQQHNEVEIETAGDNFRRMVELQGSDSGSQWSTLVTGAILFRFSAGGRSVDKKTVVYPVSRYRYLRIRVERDSQVDRGAPEVKGIEIRRSVRIQGETVTFPGIAMRDADRANGRPASVWRVDFGGRIPIERLVLTTPDAAFSRPYLVEAVDDPSAPVALASGELVRREDARNRQPAIEFAEHDARHVKLTVTDDRNPALTIVEVTAQGAARQVILRTEAAGAGPIRLYYGNPKAIEPNYDLGVELGAALSPAPVRLQLGPQRENPIYSPEPRPFSERSPWLVYVVLTAASAALAAILLSLVRGAKEVPAS